MTFVPTPLVDPVPGNIGLLPGKYAVIALRLDEDDGVLPSDHLRNLDDLAPDFGFTTLPTQVQAWTGPGRLFAGANGLLAADLAGRDTLLQRDLTIQVILATQLGGGAQATSTIIARGNHDGTVSNAWSYGLELFSPGGGSGNVGVRWFWEDSAGVVHTDAGVTLQSPGDGAYFVLTATRRWESTTSVVMRYFANDHLLGQTTSANGDIAGGTTGITTLGGRLNRLTGLLANDYWEHQLVGAIDELVVSSIEMSPEEVAQVYARLAVHQPAGVDAFAGLAPKGAPWYADPGNRIGRHVKVAGQAIGLGIAAAEEHRALWLPDAAPIETIARWERLCGLSPGPHDSLDKRRQRVVGYFARTPGYSTPDVAAAMATVLDCLPGDLQILEFDNQITDPLTTLAAERWLVGDTGAWAIVGGALQVSAAGGADIRWEPSRKHATCLTPLFLSQTQPNTNYFLACEVTAYAIPHNSIAGLQLFDRVLNTWLTFGIYVDGGGTAHIGYAFWSTTSGGVVFTALAAAPAAPVWLRLQSQPHAGGTTQYMFSWSTVGPTPTSSFTTALLVSSFGTAQWAGFAIASTDAALSGNLNVSFANFVMNCPNGDRPFYWYVYRNPALGGNPDLVGARLLANKLKPAHTFVGVIQNTSLLCDDGRDGLCDIGPMGGL